MLLSVLCLFWEVAHNYRCFAGTRQLSKDIALPWSLLLRNTASVVNEVKKDIHDTRNTPPLSTPSPQHPPPSLCQPCYKWLGRNMNRWCHVAGIHLGQNLTLALVWCWKIFREYYAQAYASSELDEMMIIGKGVWGGGAILLMGFTQHGKHRISNLRPSFIDVLVNNFSCSLPVHMHCGFLWYPLYKFAGGSPTSMHLAVPVVSP